MLVNDLLQPLLKKIITNSQMINNLFIKKRFQ